MADREIHSVNSRTIGRVQLARNPIAPPRKTLLVSPRAQDKERSASPALENLKQWELIEGDRGLRVVEKRVSSGAVPARSIKSYAAPAPPVPPKRGNADPDKRALCHEELARKFKAFERSNIVQAISPSKLTDNNDSNEAINPITLDTILKNKRTVPEESTDMLDQLERQVKAIEMGTIAARNKMRDSSELQPEIQLRYREHEDLLNNVTDDEAEG